MLYDMEQVSYYDLVQHNLFNWIYLVVEYHKRLYDIQPRFYVGGE